MWVFKGLSEVPFQPLCVRIYRPYRVTVNSNSGIIRDRLSTKSQPTYLEE